MNHNIDLPNDLRQISKPEFRISDEQLIIFNKPLWSDWVFEVVTFCAILFFASNKNEISYSNEYMTLFIVFWLYGLSYFSLNKISLILNSEQSI